MSSPILKKKPPFGTLKEKPIWEFIFVWCGALCHCYYSNGIKATILTVESGREKKIHINCKQKSENSKATRALGYCSSV